MSIFEAALLSVVLAGLIVGLIWLAGSAAAAVEKDREQDEHRDGLPL